MATKKKVVNAVKAKKAVKAVAPVSTSKIKAYKPRVTVIELDHSSFEGNMQFGGWDAKKHELTSMQFVALMEHDQCPVQWALDCIALAIEAGTIDSDTFVKQAFKTRDDFDAFCDALSEYEDYWINERHFHALIALIVDQYNASTYPMAAETLASKYRQLAA